MSEFDVQNAIYSRCVNATTTVLGVPRNRFYSITPNTKFFGWESDLLMTDNFRRCFEYEIKLSKSDFKRDFRDKTAKHEALRLQTGSTRIPAFFYFVAPITEVSLDDIPAYAGLYTFNTYICSARGKVIENLTCAKIAPKLTNDIFDIQDTNRLLNSVYFKYWNRRQKAVKKQILK